jgi:hypothetical protein
MMATATVGRPSLRLVVEGQEPHTSARSDATEGSLAQLYRETALSARALAQRLGPDDLLSLSCGALADALQLRLVRMGGE